MINAAVLGSPIAHSLSPLIHSLAYEYLGLAAQYEAVEVKAGALANYLSQTDKNCLSAVAARVSCGNTLSLRDGKWNLTSTDVSGFDNALKMHGIQKADSVLIIGAGATARAAIASVSAITTNVAVVSRNPDREAAITKASSISVSYLPWEVTDALNSVDLVINTTPGQAADYFLSGIDKPRGTLFEVLYHPWPTVISKAWTDSQAQVIDGLDLLIHQAIAQVEIFSGVACDRELLYAKMRKAALTKLA
jgi:shikimate dehydrogenase